MVEILPPAGAVFQYRKGGDVLLARSLGSKGGKVLGTGEDGKRVELPPDRVLQVAGEVGAAIADADARARLRDVRAGAEALVPGVDLGLLWEQVRGGLDGAPIEELVQVYFGRSGAPAERLAFGFALCADRVHFRQKGEVFVPRMEAEVAAALERREQERRAAERRAAFLGWVRAGLAAGAGSPLPGEAHATGSGARGPAPEGAEGEIAAIEDLAIRGDEAPHAARARQLLKEVAEVADPSTPLRSAPFDPAQGRQGERIAFQPTPDGAFDLLVRLGVFSEHENLALRRAGIPTRFAPEVLAAAAAVAPYAAGADPRRRVLPAGVPAVTIDDAETLDRDDAVSLEALPDGRRRLGIHIAAVAWFVPMGSPLDDEAARRGTTVYLPRGKIPMFPPALSERRMSLDADGAPRPALSFYVTLSPELAIEGEEVQETELVVSRNLAYEEVDAVLGGGGAGAAAAGFPDVRDAGETLEIARREAPQQGSGAPRDSLPRGGGAAPPGQPRSGRSTLSAASSTRIASRAARSTSRGPRSRSWSTSGGRSSSGGSRPAPRRASSSPS